MRKQVSATRMELLNQKKKLGLARRGHKLLKDKQDELLRVLQDLIKEVMQMRREVEDELIKAMKRFVLARAVTEPMYIEDAFMISTST
ncbi:V-type ATP synthase subunit D, partial [bacterium]